MSKEKEMSFLSHLEELRWHLVRSVVSILVFSIVIFNFPQILFHDIVLGPSRETFVSYQLLCQLGQLLGMQSLCLNQSQLVEFQNTQMAGQLTYHIWASLIAGFILAFPYVAWEIWRFVKPALYHKEKKNITGLVIFVSLLFFMGVSFAYFIIVPLTVNFLLTYNVMGDTVKNNPLISSYFSTVLNLVLGTGVIFQMPIFIYFLAKIGLVSPKFLKRYRRHSIVIIMILAAIITPPDVVSQILVAIPLLVLYEISILIAKRVYKEP
jgi:sec-independent protein translocase protein TatC